MSESPYHIGRKNFIYTHTFVWSVDQGKNAVYMKGIPVELLTFHIAELINSGMINITLERTFNVSFDIPEKKSVFFPFDKVSTVAFGLNPFYDYGINKT